VCDKGQEVAKSEDYCEEIRRLDAQSLAMHVRIIALRGLLSGGQDSFQGTQRFFGIDAFLL
jgi:hypothetical protein